jgi:hypothetical protein
VARAPRAILAACDHDNSHIPPTRRHRVARCFRAASATATNVHGCWCAPLGAVPAARIAYSISRRSTGSGEKCRVVRRRSRCS